MARTSANARSAKVLDDAERQMAIMDWRLFVMEQESKLWAYDPYVKWTPGTPIYPHPWSRMAPEEAYDDFEDVGGPWGVHVRPMIQLFDIDYVFPTHEHYVCGSCEVFGDPSDFECWSCGAKFKKPEPVQMMTLADYRARQNGRSEMAHTNLEAFVQERLTAEMVSSWAIRVNQVFAEMAGSARRIGEAIRPMLIWSHSSNWRNLSSYHYEFPRPEGVPYHPPTSGYVANPNRPWYEKADVVGPVWGVAALYDPREESPLISRHDWNEIQRIIPANWAELRNPVLLPNMPELPAIEDKIPEWVRRNNREHTSRRFK